MVSACHTMAGARPEISVSARAMSRSRLMPGKTTTAAFMPRSSSQHLDLIILDDHVGEKLVGRLLERGLGARLIGAVDLDIEHLALPHARDAGDAERLERTFDRLALRVEHARLEGDGDTGFHRGALLIPPLKGEVAGRRPAGGVNTRTQKLAARGRDEAIPSPVPGRCPAGARSRS